MTFHSFGVSGLRVRGLRVEVAGFPLSPSPTSHETGHTSWAVTERDLDLFRVQVWGLGFKGLRDLNQGFRGFGDSMRVLVLVGFELGVYT